MKNEVKNINLELNIRLGNQSEIENALNFQKIPSLSKNLIPIKRKYTCVQLTYKSTTNKNQHQPNPTVAGSFIKFR